MRGFIQRKKTPQWLLHQGPLSPLQTPVQMNIETGAKCILKKGAQLDGGKPGYSLSEVARTTGEF